MNLKNLLKLGTLTLLVTLVLSSLSYGQTVRYLNSTDGDDSYTGLNATNNPPGTGPKRTFEGAYAAFPDGATVYVKAGEYYFDQSAVFDGNGVAGGNDANGISFTGAKSMTFIIQTYNASNIVYFNGPVAGAFIVNPGAGKTIAFQAADAGVQSVSINNGAFSNTATNAITLTSGTLDVSGLASFNVGGTVLTMTRTAGAVVGTFTYSAANRTMVYNGTAAQTTGGELQTTLAGSTLTINKATGTLTVAQNLTATTGGIIQNTNAASAVFNGTVSIAGAAAAPSLIQNTNTGGMTFNGAVTFSSRNEVWGTYIQNTNTGTLAFPGGLAINHGGTTASDLDEAGLFSDGVANNETNLIQNTNTGTLSITNMTFGVYTTGGVNYYAFVVLRNTSTGTVNIGGSDVYGMLKNNTGGSVNLTGNLTFKTSANVTPDNTLENGAAGSKVKLNTFNLDITYGGQATSAVNNVGGITSNGINIGLFKFSHAAGVAVVAGAGAFPSVEVAGAGNVTGGFPATSIVGNVTLSAGGDLTMTGTPATISGSVYITGAGAVFTTPGSLQINQNVNISNGTFTTGGNVVLQGNYTQAVGAFVFGGAHTFDVKGNFNRTSGNFTNTTGNLQFSSGGQGQICAGGPNFKVFDFTVSGVGTGLTLQNGSVEIVNSCTVNANTSIQLGDLNIRMVGNGTPTTITNGGQIFSSGLGSVIFEGTNNPTGAAIDNNVHTIGGTGKYSNIEVRLAEPIDRITVAAGTVVSWTGRLTLFRGGVFIPNACQFNPIDAAPPSIWRNLNDSDVDGNPDGQVFAWAGTGDFNANNVIYDLTFFGTLAVAENVANNVWDDNLVRNLTVLSTGGFPVRVNNARTILGNVEVARNADLRPFGANLIATTTTTSTHTIYGTVSENNAGNWFGLAGTGDHTIVGGTNALDQALIENLDVSSTGNVVINGLKQIGKNTPTNLGLVVNSGTVTLGLQADAVPSPGDMYNYAQNGGSVDLTTDVEVPAFGNTSFNIAGASLTFDFNDFNIWWNSANNFTAAGTTSFLATDATTKGYLQYRATGGLNTNGARLARIIIDPANTGGITATLISNSGVNQIFTNSNTGTLALAGFDFTNAGTEWNTTGLYTGPVASEMILTGPVTVSLSGSITVPSLTFNSTTNTVTLFDNDGVVGTPTITVQGIVRLTSGTIEQNLVDVIMDDALGNTTVFIFTAGTVNATTTNSITATNAQNGEFVFDGATAKTFQTTAAGMILPNVRVNGTGNITIAAAPNNNAFTVSKRLVLANTGDLATGANAKLIMGDGAWIVRQNNGGILSHVPTFGTLGTDINLHYQAAALIVPANEMPATVTGLYVDNGAGIDVDASKNVTVNTILYLNAGNYDFENVLGTIRTITMAANSMVRVNNGNLINSAAGGATTRLLGGPVTLEYINTAFRATTTREFSDAAGFVSLLNVFTTAANGTTGGLQLHANRTVGDFVLNTGAAGVNTIIFNLNGLTLTVSNTASATLTKGVLSSLNEVTDIYTYATLASNGPVTSTANATVYNTNITAPTMTLAGTFGRMDHDLDGAANNVLPAGFPTSTISGDATVANYAGNLVITGNTVINGAYTNGTITTQGNVTVSATGSLNATSNIVWTGATNATLTVPAAGTTVGSLTFNKTNNTNTVTLAGGNIAQVRNGGALTTFVNGLFIVPDPLVFTMNQPNWGGGQGFTRVGVTGTNISHVVGHVAKVSFNAGGPGLGASSESRFEFPVGTTTLYRPVALTFNPSFGLPTMPNSTFTVNHVNSNPGGAVALPIVDGVATGIDVARYPAFYWTIASAPSSIGPSTLFDLELTARGFTDFDDINNVRIIRRHGLVTDLTNQWLFQGTIGVPYDNEVNDGVPSIIQKNANAGLRLGGAVFTLGLKSNMSIKTAIPKQWLVLSQGEKSYNLANVFEGNVGSLTFTAQSSNGTILTTAITGSTLKITPVAIGDAVVTIIASDAANNDFFAYSFDVNVGLTDVEEVAEIPTEFSLSQNYPNPFNPTTNIKFGLPKESNVTLRIFNILGEEVATLVNKVMPAGFHTINFDASRMTSGMYIYRIEADNFVQVKKMLLMK
ncbi:MAG TPA: T9SS type A sorting domain-containing protein [Melioribacteraceae bacterium]|nr:T9SS type A sorting domain-containing protein [Melioribacteraceae bacterium]